MRARKKSLGVRPFHQRVRRYIAIVIIIIIVVIIIFIIIIRTRRGSSMGALLRVGRGRAKRIFGSFSS